VQIGSEVRGAVYELSSPIPRLPGDASPGSGSGSALKGFDLKTGAGKVSVPFPGNRPLCNDIAVAKDGRVYVSDEYSARVLRLSADSHSLEVWVSDPQLADIDGIASVPTATSMPTLTRAADFSASTCSTRRPARS
jgi:hypothetical protein